VLNLRGRDVSFMQVFRAYLFIGINTTVLFIELAKISDAVSSYLNDLDVTVKDYNEVWAYLRDQGWGDGNVRVFDI
jgi:Xaa-Pro aminopeptidase